MDIGASGSDVESNGQESAGRDLLSSEYLRALPKAEVHCHLEGSVPPALAADLAHRHGLELPETGAEGLYDFSTLEEFLEIYVAVSRSMQTTADFEEVTYASLMAAADGGLRYREIAFNPSNHPDLSYPEMIDGILRGARAVEREVGIVSRIIVAINRELGGDVALDLVKEVIANPYDEVVGIGLDHNELVARPSEFTAAYALAHEAGLKLCAHTGERGDPTEIVECLDLLHVDRVDHGYAVLQDQALLARCVESQIPYSMCWIIDFPPGMAQARHRDVADMTAAGLNVSLSSDDPGMIGPQLGEDFVDAARRLAWTVEHAERFAMSGLDAAFADQATLDRLRADFRAELDRLRPLAYDPS